MAAGVHVQQNKPQVDVDGTELSVKRGPFSGKIDLSNLDASIRAGVGIASAGVSYKDGTLSVDGKLGVAGVTLTFDDQGTLTKVETGVGPQGTVGGPDANVSGNATASLGVNLNADGSTKSISVTLAAGASINLPQATASVAAAVDVVNGLMPGEANSFSFKFDANMTILGVDIGSVHYTWDGNQFIRDAAYQMNKSQLGSEDDDKGYVDLNNWCFAPGTNISGCAGEYTLIENIKIGDIVAAFDGSINFGRGKLVFRRVCQVFKGTTDEWLILLMSG